MCNKNVQAQHYCYDCSINKIFPSENHMLMSYRLLEFDKVKKLPLGIKY